MLLSMKWFHGLINVCRYLKIVFRMMCSGCGKQELNTKLPDKNKEVIAMSL